jgi:hypothetical protein
MWRVLTLLCLLCPLPAAGQTVQEVRAHLEREARRGGCDLYRPVHVHTGLLAGDARPVGIAVFTLEGCGEGNNWGRTVGVFVREGQRLVELPRARDIRGLPEVVEGVRVENGLILVQGLDYGPNDARCCPSVRRSVALTLRDGMVVNAR